MKKNTKRILLIALCLSLLLSVFAFVGCKDRDRDINTDEENNVIVSTLPEYFETYAVGETIYIENSNVKVNGKTYLLYGVLIKDGNIYTTLTPEQSFVTCRFEESGKYSVLYYYVDNGVQYIVKNVDFTVGVQPYFNIAFKSEYLVNETIALTADCVYEAAKFGSSVKAVSPYGEELDVSKLQLALNDNGIYKVTYSAQIEEDLFVREYSFNVTGRAKYYKDYILPISGVTNTVDDYVAPDYVSDYVDSPEQDGTGGKGVLVEMEGRGSFRFRNTIDLSEADKNTDLIKFAILGADGYDQLTGMKVKLVDVYDADNTVYFDLSAVDNIPDPEIENSKAAQWVYAKVNYKGTFYSYDWGSGAMEINSRYGTGTNLLFNVGLLESDAIEVGNNPQAVGKVTWGHFQFDYENKGFYVTVGQYNSKFSKKRQMLVADLDDPNVVGADNLWSGFTTGEVYLEVEVTGTGTKTGLIIQEIAGEKLYKDNDNDKAPTVRFNELVDGKLPIGVVDKFYPFADVSYSIDVIDGKVDHPEYRVISLQKEILPYVKYVDVEYEKNGFTPKSSGKYVVAYRTYDQDGNYTDDKFIFEVKESLGNLGIEYSYDLPEKFDVGTYFTVPELHKKGFSYLSTCKESIVYNGNEYAGKQNEKVFLDKAGEIKVKCEYVDFLGTEYQYEKTYSVSVSNSPITQIIGTLPEYVIKGKTIVLPDMSAINYNKQPDDTDYKANWKLLVDGEGVDTVERAIQIKKNHGEKIAVQYILGENVVLEKQMTVIEAKYLSDRFYDSNGIATSKSKKDCVSVELDEDTTVNYINPIIIDDATKTIPLQFNLPEEKSSFTDITIYFEDHSNSDMTLTVKVLKKPDGLYAQLNGIGDLYKLTKTKDGVYEIIYSIKLNSFSINYRAIAEKTCTGKTFKGFSSKLINVRFEFNGVNGQTELEVYKISDITLKSSLSSDGVTVNEYVDKTVPILVSEGSFRDNPMTLGTTMKIPAVTARTVLSGLTTARISVTAPSGKKVINSLNAYNDCSFVIDEIGTYKITYSVAFINGKRDLNYSFRVFGEDSAEITLAETLKEVQSLNKTLILPEVNVSNVEDYTYVYYLVKPDYSRKKVNAGDKVDLNQIGTYRLEIVVTDKHNVTYKSFTFITEA